MLISQADQKCCKCSWPAKGRYVFLNAQKEVVDNPFCTQHWWLVLKQTKKSIEGWKGLSDDVRMEFWGSHPEDDPMIANTPLTMGFLAETGISDV